MWTSLAPLLPTLLILAACRPAEQPPDIDALDLGDADAVAAVGFGRAGLHQPVTILRGVARWGEHQADLGGSVHRVARADLSGDGRDEALVATGMGRGFRDAPARLWALGAEGAELLWEHHGPRNQVADLRVEDGQVWLAAFEDKWQVQAGWLRGGRLEVVSGGHLAMQQVPVGPGAVVVGRLYGEEPRSDGDLTLRTPSGDHPLPSLRGVKAIESADLDGDGVPELLVGDGWHHAYGQHGTARIRLLEGPDWTSARTIASFDGEYTVREIVVLGAGVDAALLATGTSHVHLISRDPLGWADQAVAPISETGNAVVIQLPSGPAALVSGEPAQVVPLAR